MPSPTTTDDRTPGASGASVAGAPRFREVARRPQWIGALLLALAIAAAFAALGQWQIERSIAEATVVSPDTERVRPLAEVVQPGEPTSDAQAGQMVEVSGEVIAGDTVYRSGREGAGGTDSVWVVGHLVTDEGVSLPVALGWAPDADAARAAAPDTDQPLTVTGRYLPTESPQEGAYQTEQTAIAVAELVNVWAEVGDVYSGYVVSADAWPGLELLDSPANSEERQLNLLNLFYAVEWAIFGGFAIYLWVRLVKDAVERETEQLQDAAASRASAGDGAGTGSDAAVD